MGRHLYLAEPADLQAARDLVPPKRPFGLFLALDATEVQDDKLNELATHFVAEGAVYVCAWGPDCERVHDAFDRAGEASLADQPTEDDVMMTTWHHDDTLEDAFWFFAVAASPTESYIEACETWLAVTVGDAGWATRLQNAASDL